MYINQPHSDPFAPRQPIGDIQLGGKDEPDIPNIAYYTTPSDYENKGRPLICSMNLRSLLKRKTQLQEFIQTVPAQKVIGIQEIWKLRHVPRFDGYHPLYFKQREGMNGGGVALLISSDIVFSKVDSHFTCGDVETIAIDMEFQEKKFRIINLYKAPRVSQSELLEVLETLPLSQPDREIILMGDFNQDTLKREDEATSEYLASLGLTNIIDLPTRVDGDSQTILDHFYTTYKRSDGIVFQTDNLADHWPVAMEIGRKMKKPRPEDSLIPLQDTESLTLLKKHLGEVDWSPVYNDNTTNSFSIFHKIFQERHTMCCPLVKANKKFTPVQPFMTKGLLKCRKVKDKMYRKCSLKRGTEAWLKYTRYRQVYKETIKTAKRIFYEQEFANADKDTKKIWKVADRICGRSKAKGEGIGDIKDCLNNQQKCNKFNDFYTNIADSLAKDLPKAEVSHKEFLPKIKIKSKFKPKDVNEKGVLKTIKGLKPKSSFSFDYVSNKQLRFVAEELCGPLTHLINLSFRLAYVPPEWKQSRIIPIFKSGQKDIVSNYRPVALLSTFSKILEKEMSYQIWRHLEANNIISNQQYGFKKHHSTEDLLIDFMDRIFKSKNKRNYTAAIFVDTCKAFDCVNHSILLSKLAHYGFDTAWFEDYLKDGVQQVFIGNKKSTKVKLNIGVRQGSILGPIFFLVMIQDLSEISDLMSVLLYADDTSFLGDNESLEKLYENLNREMKKVESWFIANRLTIHPGKCKYILFSSDKAPQPLQILGKEIERVEQFKLVGLILDQNLNFQPHVENVRAKVSAALSMITRSKRHLPMDVKKLLFNALIQSHLQYAISIYGATTDGILDPLIKIQKKALRIVANAKWISHCEPLWKKVGALKFSDLHKLACTKKAYKIINGIAPAGITPIFKPKCVRSRRLEHFAQLKVPFARIAQTQNLPSYQIPYLWNSLPSNISMTSINSFSDSFKKYKLTHYGGFICTTPNCYSCANS